MRFNQTQFLSSIAFAIDFIEMDVLKNVSFHNKRVAYIADSLAQAMGFSDAERLDLATCALLHDSGAAKYQFEKRIARNTMEGPKEHCIYSQKILDIFPLSGSHDTTLLYHHEYADGSGYLGKTDIPISAQIIAISDMTEQQFNAGKNRNEVVLFIEKNRGVKFEANLVDLFLEEADRPAFWMDMEPLFISNVLDKRLPTNESERSWTDIRKLTKVLSGIIDTKSTFTANHSSGLSDKAGKMAEFYRFEDDHKTKLLIAADLHDLGKLAMPNAILDKPDKLTAEEFAVIKGHTYYTRRALEVIPGFEDITEWASNHHEILTGKGYPFGKKNLGIEERLLAVLDVYQALTEDRPYRIGMSHDEAQSILNKMSSEGKLDVDIIHDVNEVFSKLV